MALTNLNRKLYNIDRRPSQRKSKKKIYMRLIILLVIVGIAIFLPAKVIYESAKEVSYNAKAISSAYGNQNFGQLVESVGDTKDSVGKINTSLNFLVWLKIIPIVGGYYMDAKGFSSAGEHELIALENILTELKPAEKELGFLGTPIAGQDRISQAIKILDKATPLLEKNKDHFSKAKKDVENIDTNKYPENFRGINLRASLAAAKNLFMGTEFIVTTGKDALAIAPAALGYPNSKSYLMLFQNDKEIRPTGGFMTAYANIKMNKGQINADTSDDIYRLDEQLLNVCLNVICPLTPPAAIAKYLPEVDGKPRKAWSMRDSNLSPDVPTSAADFEKMYSFLGGGLPFDGIIYIDTQVVEELIEVTGPIEVLGTKYSAETDHRCNCPNVIYELESYAEIAAKGEKDRKAVLGVLMQQVLAKLVAADVEKLPEVIDTVVRLANHKHIMFYMHDDKVQKAVSDLNWTGQIKEYDGDYLHINDANFAGGKSNLYVDQKVTQEIEIKNGEVSKKIIIDYKNPQPFGIWLNAINRSYVRIYAPLGSKLVSSKGSDDPVKESEDLGKTVFEAFVVTRPQNSRKLELEFTVPYKPNGDYKMLIQKQPGAKDFEYVIKVNGSQKANFKLDTDQELKFNY